MNKKISVLLMLLLSLLCWGEAFSQDDPHEYRRNKDRQPYREEKADTNKNQDKENKRKAQERKIDVGTKDSKRKLVKRNYNVGIKGGMVFSYVSSKAFNIDSQMDGSVYLAHDIRLYDSFFVEIDFGYHAATFNSGDNFFKIQYFTIPVIFKYYFSNFFLDPKTVEFWAGVGLELRFKVGDSGFSWATQATEDDQGVVFALGGRTNIAEGLYLNVDFRFYLGLAPAFKTTADEKGYLREFELLFGLSYDIF